MRLHLRIVALNNADRASPEIGEAAISYLGRRSLCQYCPNVIQRHLVSMNNLLKGNSAFSGGTSGDYPVHPLSRNRRHPVKVLVVVPNRQTGLLGGCRYYQVGDLDATVVKGGMVGKKALDLDGALKHRLIAGRMLQSRKPVAQHVVIGPASGAEQKLQVNLSAADDHKTPQRLLPNRKYLWFAADVPGACVGQPRPAECYQAFEACKVSSLSSMPS